MEKTIKAKLLTPTQLKMLDIGAPVIVSCQTLTGETVAVRLQTANLEPDPDIDSGARNKPGKANGRHAKGCWLAHGAYVAVMPNGGRE
jgi:hypothetical protein